MALPWQADFFACGNEWWPAARPNQVRRQGASADWVPESWRFLDMIDRWDQLGFVVKNADAYVETERLEGAPVS